MRIGLTLILLTAGLCAGLWFALSGRETMPAARFAELVEPGAARGFNVLLVTLDTTRRDRLGCYGWPSARTAAIDGLLEHGVRFDRAVASAPITLPSHTTIMTGLYPPRHGARDNGFYRVSPEVTTLAERLAAGGYRTAAFISAFVLDKRYGLARGFERYDFEPGGDTRRNPLGRHNERRALDTTNAVLRWLREAAPAAARDEKPEQSAGAPGAAAGTAPWFCWVHYFDPHAPYDAPIPPATADRGGAYDAEIAFIDLHFRRLRQRWTHPGSARTVIVLTADHGESLQEHGEDCHTIFIYGSTMRVPLIISNPLLFGQPYRVDDGLVGLVDVMPTVLDLLGEPVPDSLDGISLVRKRPPADRMIYMETMSPATNLACSPLYGARVLDAKYIRAPRAEYYALRDDPDELDNLFGSDRPEIATLAGRLDTIRGAWQELEQSAPGYLVSPEEADRLAALGYAGASAASAAGGDCDPKDRVEHVNRMGQVQQMVAEGREDEALAVCRELRAEAPDWATPVRFAARAHIRRQQWRAAVDLLEDYLQDHASALLFQQLGTAYLSLEAWDEALRASEAANTLEPGLGEAWIVRGDVYAARGETSEARAAYAEALRRDPARCGAKARQRLASLD